MSEIASSRKPGRPARDLRALVAAYVAELERAPWRISLSELHQRAAPYEPLYMCRKALEQALATMPGKWERLNRTLYRALPKRSHP